MARADLLLKLVQSGSNGDRELFRKVVQSVIAEERGKQHHVLATELEQILTQFPLEPSSNKHPLNGNGASRIDDKIRQFLLENYPQVQLNDLLLDYKVRESAMELILEHQRADLLRSYNLEPRHRVLLVGEPGNGKTSLAEAIAAELMLPFFTVRYEGIIGSYLGETASRLSKMFEYIVTRECVLFFDEFDAIGKERGDEHETGEIKRVVNSLLLQVDKLPSYVVVVAATNHPELLDRAVWRRFQLRLELKKPGKSEIETYLRRFESRLNMPLQTKIPALAEKLIGVSYADLAEFTLDIRRKFVMALPDAEMKKIVPQVLDQFISRLKIRAHESKETLNLSKANPPSKN